MKNGSNGLTRTITVIVGVATVLVILLGGVFNLSQSVNDLKNIGHQNGTAIERNCLVLKQLSLDLRLHELDSLGPDQRRGATTLPQAVDC